MSDRLVTPKMTEEEQAIEGSLRPRRLAEYIGQEKIKENLSILLEAARRRNESVDHVLLYGPPGLGKTTLCNIISVEMGVSMKTTSGPAIEHAGGGKVVQYRNRILPLAVLRTVLDSGGADASTACWGK